MLFYTPSFGYLVNDCNLASRFKKFGVGAGDQGERGSKMPLADGELLNLGEQSRTEQGAFGPINTRSRSGLCSENNAVYLGRSSELAAFIKLL